MPSAPAGNQFANAPAVIGNSGALLAPSRTRTTIRETIAPVADAAMSEGMKPVRSVSTPQDKAMYVSARRGPRPVRRCRRESAAARSEVEAAEDPAELGVAEAELLLDARHRNRQVIAQQVVDEAQDEQHAEDPVAHRDRACAAHAFIALRSPRSRVRSDRIRVPH